jgi:acyl transferase domain-containing protein
VIGHSSGEIAAAYCAGVISKTYALSLALFKGVAVGAASQMNSRRGGMMAVRMSPKKCEEMLSTLGVPPDSRQNALQVACYNSPQNVTLSGDKREIERLETLLQVEGIMAKKLNVAIAYHNAQHMQTAAGLYRTLIHDLPSNKADSKKLSSPQCFFLSSARGTCFEPESDASEISMPSYWVDNLISPVRFTEAMQSLASLLNIKDALSDTHFVEVGPHSTLKSAIKEALPKEWNVEQCYSPILSRQQPAMLTSLTMAGRLHCLGYPLDITAVNQVSLMSNGAQRILAGLPPYPFDRSKQYWLESRTSKNYRLRRFPHHDFLGTPSSNWNSLDAQWNNRIILQEKAFVRDHKVSSKRVIRTLRCIFPKLVRSTN